MAGTQQDMLNRIQDEMQRTDLDDQTILAQTQAIAYFQNDAFYLSDNFSTATLVASQQVYTLPSDFAWERDAYITQNGDRYEVRKVSFEFLTAENSAISSPTLGSPIDYALFNNSYYLFPIPDGNNVYTFSFSYVSMIPAPATLSTTGNFWMTTAEPVIRNWTKYLLYNEVLQQPDLAKQFQDRAMEEHYKLREITSMRKWTGNIAATKF
jgi:hypothetical protein